jgi:hypothetical protein
MFWNDIGRWNPATTIVLARANSYLPSPIHNRILASENIAAN